MELMKLAYADV